MLHIVNGDTVAERLKQGVVQEEVLPWREIFVEGALVENVSEQQALHRRANSLEQSMGIPAQIYIENVLQQEQRLNQAIANEEPIVLWFEHDLFDQTILCYLLYRLYKASFPCHQLYVLSINQFPGIDPFQGMGQLSVKQMKTLTGTQTPMYAEQVKLGYEAWRAYSSANPRDLEQLLLQHTKELPFLKDALRFHLSRFPSTTNGLNNVEQMVLQFLSNNKYRPQHLYRLVYDQVPLSGMGDLQFWSILRQLYTCSLPLIEILPASSGTKQKNAIFPTYKATDPSFWDSEIQITAHGEAVLRGEKDRIHTCGMDYWIGGVHLFANPSGERKCCPIWRWDPQYKKLCFV